MDFQPSFTSGVLLRRYKRFLADVDFGEKGVETVHCPNTGSMKNCLADNSTCWTSVSDNKKRKYPRTLEIVTTPTGQLAGINTARANGLVEEALQNNVITQLRGYAQIRREQASPVDKSRMDFLLSEHQGDEPNCYVEVKSVTLQEADGFGYFPDSVSERGKRHLEALTEIVAQGLRAALVFCVQHTGIERVRPADHIDPKYGAALRHALAAGVEILAYKADISPQSITLKQQLPVETPD
jgi:sugar fermentation stimulation protein A